MKTSARARLFAFIGIILTVANFIIYAIIARFIPGNELLWLDSMISYLLVTFLAYFLHSKYTWKERPVTKIGVINFFVWNLITALIISPVLTELFRLLKPVYEFIFNLSASINLPFDYAFIESTSIFILSATITMILNYLFYDKLVFGTKKEETPKKSLKDLTGKVSIIIPMYNAKKYLKKCLGSVLGQTYKNLEIILIDDGSTDGSGKIADEYAKKDKRLKVIHQENAGQSAGRNRGLKLATGDYISFIDSDDEIELTFIEDLLAAINNKTSLSVCGMNYRRLASNSAKNVYINPLPKHKNESKTVFVLRLLALDGRMYSSVNKLYHVKTAKTCHFDESLNFSEDTNFVLDYLKKAKGEISFVLKPLYIYNFGTESSTVKSSGADWKNWQASYENLKNWTGKKPGFKARFWLTAIYLRWRISHFRMR